MKNKLKFGLWLIVAALILISISIYFLNKASTGSEECDEDAGVCPVEIASPEINLESPSEEEEVSGNTYKNEKYNFSLELDPALSSAKVESTKDDDAEQVIEFKFDDNLEPLDIYVYKPSVWEGLDNSALIEIARDDDYVYAYKRWEAPEDSSLITEKAIADTINTFKLNNNLNNEEEGA